MRSPRGYSLAGLWDRSAALIADSRDLRQEAQAARQKSAECREIAERLITKSVVRRHANARGVQDC
jgi:hypothetical protein